MFAWITARRIREGMMEQFLRVWQDPGMSPPSSPPGEEGPTVYALFPTDDPNEMWGVGFFDSLETIRNLRESPRMQRRAEALEPFIEEILWERTFEARPWSEQDRPLAYAVYIRPRPASRFRLAVISRDAGDAIAQADALVEQVRAADCPQAEWTMRAYESSADAPETLLPTEGHLHPAAG